MTWKERVRPIKVGDRVASSAEFLKRTGQHPGDVPLARGIVEKPIPLGEIPFTDS